ncbi:MAG: winged helix-turn-helix transcriptional regulator [Firmicutes bacterium]|nr:winged helix-turn-helix transcriptional regulator [Bacillota bacterium]
MLKGLEIIFKALGETTRLKIVKLVADRELCVCEIVAVLGTNQPRVSQHLKVLKAAGILEERKERQWSFYRLNQEFREGLVRQYIDYMKADIRDLKEFAHEVEHLDGLAGNEEVNACKNTPLQIIKRAE